MSRLRLPTLALAFALFGCDSQINMSATPAAPPLEAAQGASAVVTAGAAGSLVTIDKPTQLPESVRNAADLKVAFGGVKVPVARNAGGYYTFNVPASARLNPDVAGNIKVTFIMNDKDSQIITLRTGSPVPFAQPAILTDPSPAFINRGLDVKLTANTTASTEQYQFTWSYSATGTAPWVAIPGQGKQVNWTPPQAGNYFIKVDTVDKSTQTSYPTVTPQALVFVTDSDTLVTTTPSSGSLERGNEVALKFNAPAGLKPGNYTYAWSFASSPTGPFTNINGSTDTVNWLPTNIGSYYIRTELTNKDTGVVNAFVTPKTVVSVSEGRPIVTADTQTAERAQKVKLTLNLPNPGNGPFTWYYQPTGSPSFVRIPGNGATVDLVTNEVGAYNFRVDLPQTGGGIKSFTTVEPQVNVYEPTPLIQTDPINQTINPGGSTTFTFKGKLDPADYRFLFAVSQSPAGPWTALPYENDNGDEAKRQGWSTTASTATGSYYVRVDAAEKNGTGNYSFVSTSPVVTVQNK